MALFTCVTVNWNRSKDVEALVESLNNELGSMGCEILVVDNGSVQEELTILEKIESKLPIKILKLDKNYGPPYARNAGASKVQSKYIFFIDSDATIDRQSVEALIGRMQSHPDMGIVGSKVLNYYTQDLDVWIYPQDPKKFQDKAFESYSFNSVTALVDCETFQAVGGFWSDIFIAMEELDLSLKFIQKNKIIYYEPRAVTQHKANPTGRVESKQLWFYQCRNSLLIYRKYFPFGVNFLLTFLYVFVFIYKGIGLNVLPLILKGIYQSFRFPHTPNIQRKLSYRESFKFLSLSRKFKIKLGR